MKPIIGLDECMKDSPAFRHSIDINERDLSVLEQKLEKITKQCGLMVQMGRAFNAEQEQLVQSMWDLSSYFGQDASVQSSLNCLLDSLKEVVNYQQILIDQATRAIHQKLSAFIKNEIKSLKEKKYWFEKASADYENLLQRSLSTTKPSEVEELDNLVITARKGFRHKAIDYVYDISMAHGKKRYEVVDALLSYSKAYDTFHHQGSDHFNDLKPSLDKISQKVSTLREEVSYFQKEIMNKHFDVNGKDLMLNENISRDSTHPVYTEGYLFKRTNNAFKTWNRRYFTLQNNQLVYRKRSGDEVTVMEDDLRLCNVKPTTVVDRRFCFEIISNVKSHTLQAESEDSLHNWVQMLQIGISHALQSNKPMNLDSSLGLSNFYDNSPQDSPQIDKTDKKQIIANILSINGNARCADCGSPDSKWASINLGITLCIECCGIHRALGVHYSKVRSLGLDNWDDEVIKVMQHLGNDIINHIYLANYNTEDGSDSVERANRDSIRDVRESWIRSKYVDRKYAMKIDDEQSMAKLLKLASLSKARRKLLRSNSQVVNSFETAGIDKDKASTSSQDSLSSSSTSSKTRSESCVSLSAGDSTVISNVTSSSEANVASPLITVTHSKVSSTATSIGDKVTKERQSSDPAPFSFGTNQELDAGLCLLLSSLPPNGLLMYGARHAKLELMALALAARADKNYVDEVGKTPLHMAVLSGTSSAVEYLLLHSVQVNVQDGEGKTPLHLASQESNIIQVYKLIKFRADQKLTDSSGKTAIDVALLSSEPELVTLLRVAALYDELDKEEVEEEMMAIMQELKRKKGSLMLTKSGNEEDG